MCHPILKNLFQVSFAPRDVIGAVQGVTFSPDLKENVLLIGERGIAEEKMSS